MIPLMKNAFLNEYETKKQLAEFILQTERLSMGKKCFEFEREFAKYQGREHAILFNSGGSANLALLQACKNLGICRVTHGRVRRTAPHLHACVCGYRSQAG